MKLFKNIINDVNTEHQQDNSKTVDENSDQLDQFLQDYIREEKAAPPIDEKLVKIIQNTWQGHMN